MSHLPCLINKIGAIIVEEPKSIYIGTKLPFSDDAVTFFGVFPSTSHQLQIQQKETLIHTYVRNTKHSQT